MLLNEKHIEEGLDHKDLWEITIQYHSDHRKHRYELVDKPKKKKKNSSEILKTKN